MIFWKQRTVLFLFPVVIFLFNPSIRAEEECTTAVFSGKATLDGRPLLWKNRDTSGDDNEVVYMTGGTYDLMGVINAGESSSVWMGINSAGFAIENSLSSDLEGSASGENGIFMKQALQNCASVDEFEQLLLSTNSSGRLTKANFGVIDALGGAAIFETGNHTFTRYDANDPIVAPEGFVVRTNFALTGDGSGTGQTRYYRAVDLIHQKLAEKKISHEYILRHIARDLKNDQIDPYPLPYEGTQNGHPNGFIHANLSINRYRTRSCAVFQGILPGEDPRLSTMWAVLGEPVCSVAVPLWIMAGEMPDEIDGTQTAPLCDASKEKDEICYPLESSPQYIDTYALDTGTNEGIFLYLFPIEDWVHGKTESKLQEWRQAFPSTDEVKSFEFDLITQIFACYLSCTVPSDALMAPLNFSYETIMNRSLSQLEYIHRLIWQAHPENINTSSYRIFLIDGQNKVFLAEVDKDTFEFWYRQVDIAKEYTYMILAVDTTGQEGNPAIITTEDNNDTSTKMGKRILMNPLTPFTLL